jgi:hypothetical protein
LSAAAVAPIDVIVPDSGTVHLFTDARECDQPGYVDCPTQNELATTGRSAGRADLSLPVAQLVGHTTTVTIHPPVCPVGSSCPEDKNPVDLCPTGCYDVTYRIDDVDSNRLPSVAAVGDGTSAGTMFDSKVGSSLPWWIEPVTRYGPSQGEENVVIERVIGDLVHH